MTLLLELDPSDEKTLQSNAARNGVPAHIFAQNLLSAALRHKADSIPVDFGVEKQTETNATEFPALTRLKMLRALPVEERNQILRAEAESVADLLNADLAKPPRERQLTAFTALDGVDALDLGDEE